MSIYITIQILTTLFSFLIVTLISIIIFKYFKKKFIILFFKYWIDISFIYFTSNLVLITNPIQNFQTILIANFIIYILLFYYLTNKSIGNLVLSKIKKTSLYLKETIGKDSTINNIVKEKKEPIIEEGKTEIINEQIIEEKGKLEENLKKTIENNKTILCKCGKENTNKEKFCSNCGSKILSIETNINPKNKKKKTEKAPIIAAIIIVILMMLGATTLGIIIIVGGGYLILKTIGIIWNFLFHRKKKIKYNTINSNLEQTTTQVAKINHNIEKKTIEKSSEKISEIKKENHIKINSKQTNLYYKLIDKSKINFSIYKFYSIFIGLILIFGSGELIMSGINHEPLGTNFLNFNSKSIISDGDYDSSFDSGIFDTNSDRVFDTYKFDINQDEKVDIKYFIEDGIINEDSFIVMEYTQEKILIILISIIIFFLLMHKIGKIDLASKKNKLATIIVFVYMIHINSFNILQLLQPTSYAISLGEIENSLKTEPIGGGPNNFIPEELEETNQGIQSSMDAWQEKRANENSQGMNTDYWDNLAEGVYDDEIPPLCSDPETRDSAQCWYYNGSNDEEEKNDYNIDEGGEDYYYNGDDENYEDNGEQEYYYDEEKYKKEQAKKAETKKQIKKIESSVDNRATNIKSTIDSTNLIINSIGLNTKGLVEQIKNIKNLPDIKNLKVELVDDYLKSLNFKYIDNASTANRLRSDKIEQLVGKIQKYEKMAGKGVPIKNYVKELKVDLSKVDEDLLKNHKFVEANANKSDLAKNIKKSQKLQKGLKVLDIGGKAFGAYLDYQEFDKEFKGDTKKVIMATTATSTVGNMLGSNPVDLVMNGVSGGLQLLGYKDAAKTAGNFTAGAIFKDTVKNSLDDDEDSIGGAVDVMVDEFNNAEGVVGKSTAAVNLGITATYAAGVYGTRKGFQLVGSGISAVGNGAKKLWSFLR